MRPYDKTPGAQIPEDIVMLRSEANSQLEGCIGLGEGANKIAAECLEIINQSIKRLNAST